jgi:hypothetical protein
MGCEKTHLIRRPSHADAGIDKNLADRALEPIEKAAARERQGKRNDLVENVHNVGGKTRDKIGAFAGRVGPHRRAPYGGPWRACRAPRSTS